MPQTRNCKIFGTVSDFSGLVLPTYSDVIKCYLYKQWNLYPTKNVPFKKIFELILKELKEIWVKASIPTVSHYRIHQMLKLFLEKYNNIKKKPKSRKKTTIEINRFRDLYEFKLFDIAACKCNLNKVCVCVCDTERKVPKFQQKLLNDQRTERKMIIGSPDIAEIKKPPKRNRLKSEAETLSTLKKEQDSDTDVSLSSNSSMSPTKDISFEYKVRKIKNEFSTTTVETTSSSNMISLVAELSDRYSVSERATAAITSTVLSASEQKTDGENTVIDRYRIRRAKEKLYSTNFIPQAHSLKAIYFDGRKDRTKKIEIVSRYLNLLLFHTIKFIILYLVQ